MRLSYTVVIVTYRRHTALLDTLRVLVPLVDPEHGKIVVVDQCPQEPLSLGLVFPSVQLITLDRAGMVNARNVGAMVATGQLVIFLDDDVEPKPGLIAGHLSAYADPKVGGVAGRLLEPGQTAGPPHPKVFDPVEGWRHAHFDHTTPGDVQTARGCNMSFRRDLLLRLGGFDPNITIFRDDTDMCFSVIAAGYCIRFVPEAELLHLNASSGGTRGPNATQDESLLGRELRMYRQLRRHYRDNLYFLVKHFQGRERLDWIWDAYCTYVGLSRWPWRFVAKNLFFLVALWQAANRARYRRYHPCTLGKGQKSSTFST